MKAIYWMVLWTDSARCQAHEALRSESLGLPERAEHYRRQWRRCMERESTARERFMLESEDGHG